MALWLINIHDGMDSGRHPEKTNFGWPAASCAFSSSICLAAAGVHGGGLLVTCAPFGRRCRVSRPRSNPDASQAPPRFFESEED